MLPALAWLQRIHGPSLTCLVILHKRKIIRKISNITHHRCGSNTRLSLIFYDENNASCKTIRYHNMPFILPISSHDRIIQMLVRICCTTLPSFKPSCEHQNPAALGLKVLLEQQRPETRAETKRAPQPHGGCYQGGSKDVKWDQGTSLRVGNCHLQHFWWVEW